MSEPLPTSIPLTLLRWGQLIADKDPAFQLLSYGLDEGSSIVRKLVTRRRADGWVFVTKTAAQFHEDTDWVDDRHVLTTLHLAISHTVYEMPAST